MIHKAIEFATVKHQNQKRKGTNIPYIVHPMEVMQILTANNCSNEVIVSGILHDTLEDTDTTIEEITSIFGSVVADIVNSESEDKTKTWKERKQATINRIKEGNLESKLVCCADKVSNLRSMFEDLKNIGDKLWGRFNASKEDIAWYYNEVYNSLSSLKDYPMYQEFKELIGKVFNVIIDI